MPIIKHLVDAAQGKHPVTAARSGHWPTVRKHHLTLHPTCAVCGGSEKLDVHHIRPFHLHPDLELDPNNLVTLCEANKGGVNCHLLFGHLGNFRSFNVEVLADADHWHTKIKTRPLADKEQA
jgi:5-methylcytosine-specific restriction enzyme A